MLKHIDPRTTPISRRGSWMNLAVLNGESRPQRGEGLYLRSNRARPYVARNLFKISIRDTAPQDHRYFAEPGYVRMDDGGEHSVEIFFEHPGSVRICGDTGIRLESAFSGSNQRENASHAVAYSESDARFIVNAKSWLRRYGLEILHGSTRFSAPWDGEMVSHADFEIEPDSSGALDLAIDEFWSTWVPAQRVESAQARNELRRNWQNFVDRFTSVAPEFKQTAESSAALIWMCTQSASGTLKREAIFMSLNWMDSVWSWDNWINMAGIAAADPELAFDQYRAIADHQDEHGAYPDAVNDGFLHFNFSKPPVQAAMVGCIEKLVPEFWNETRIQEAYPSVARFTDWWLAHRRSEQYDLCYYLHGNDSGWDNGVLLREGVPLIAPDLNAFIVSQCRLLQAWSERLGINPVEAEHWRESGDSIRNSMVAHLWRDNEFIGLKLPEAREVRSMSLMATIPALIADELPQEIQEGLQTRFNACETPLGLASEAPGSPFYEADNYWRGPIWAPSTLIGILGLRKLGNHEQANRVAANFLKLVDRSGFAENFQAETGAPLVDPGYTWTAAVFLTLAQQAR